MEKEKQIVSFIIDGNDEIYYFDRDKIDCNIPTSKSIPAEDHADKLLIEEIEKDIKRSRNNFFKVEVRIE